MSEASSRPALWPTVLAALLLAGTASAATTGYSDPGAFDAAAAGLRNVAGLDSLTPGTLVASGATTERVGWSYSLAGESLLVTDAFETPSPANSLGLTGGDEALLDGEPLTLVFPSPVTAAGLYIATSDPAAAAEITLTASGGAVSNAANPLSMLPDGGSLYFLGLVSDAPMGSTDLSFASDGEINFVYNVDEITTTAAVASTWSLSGTAEGGHPIDFAVDGVALQITTMAGQTAAHVAQVIADAINANTALQGAGIVAEASGTAVLTNGAITNTSIGDPGISGSLSISQVPALSSPALLLLLLLMMLAAQRTIRLLMEDPQ